MRPSSLPWPHVGRLALAVDTAGSQIVVARVGPAPADAAQRADERLVDRRVVGPLHRRPLLPLLLQQPLLPVVPVVQKPARVCWREL